MIAMQKRTAVCLAVAIWLAGLGTAAAITYDPNRSVHQKHGTSQHEASPAAALAAVSVQEQGNVLCIPTITIVGRAGE
jgi:predicted pyridoxine 5'-phosphate oxidase superfamily flavin-nucleotide-binding protein